MDADEHEPDRDDAEIQAADAHGRRPDEQTDRRRADAGGRQPDPDREPEPPGAPAFLAADHGGRVGADAHEEGVAEGDLPGDTGEQVEPEGGDDEDHRLGDDAQPVGVAEVADERDLVDHRQVERQQHGEDHEDGRGDPLGPRRQDRRFRLVVRVQGRPLVHRYTRRISGVPNSP